MLFLPTPALTAQHAFCRSISHFLAFSFSGTFSHFPWCVFGRFAFVKCPILWGHRGPECDIATAFSPNPFRLMSSTPLLTEPFSKKHGPVHQRETWRVQRGQGHYKWWEGGRSVEGGVPSVLINCCCVRGHPKGSQNKDIIIIIIIIINYYCCCCLMHCRFTWFRRTLGFFFYLPCEMTIEVTRMVTLSWGLWWSSVSQGLCEVDFHYSVCQPEGWSGHWHLQPNGGILSFSEVKTWGLEAITNVTFCLNKRNHKATPVLGEHLTESVTCLCCDRCVYR